MKKLIAALILTMPLIAAPTFAAGAKPTAQEKKMASCSGQAGDRTGEQREAFMKTCQQNKRDGRSAQQEKMKACSSANKGKKGEEYKQAQKDCLRK